MSELQFTIDSCVLNKLHFTTGSRKLSESELHLEPVFQCSHTINKKLVEILFNIQIAGTQLPFTMDVEYKGNFRFNQDLESIDKSIVEKTININCAAILYPFIRETIAEITRKAGFSPLILPAMNFVEFFKLKETHVEK